MALIVAGERSGVGKTTITLAILAHLAAQSDQVQSFKVGPDYIDPMFHSTITGRPCRNLDPVLTSTEYVATCFHKHIQNATWGLIEGVMGLFDGVNFPQRPLSRPDYGSTAHVARILNLPIVLILDTSRLSTSIAAIAHGYMTLDPRINFAGVILNQVASDRHLLLLEQALNQLKIPILGVLRRQKALKIPERHLGLVPTAELPGLDELMGQLADLAQQSFDWSALKPLLRQAATSANSNSSAQKTVKRANSQPVQIAVAYDPAFNFYYQDNLDILQELGAQLIYWSPLQDPAIPHQVQGLYFGGGFPEVFASQLAQNQLVLNQLRQAINHGMPTYAECGGLMYLCQAIIDFEAHSWPMVGIIPQQVQMSTKLTLGYRQAIALNSGLFCIKGQKTIGHEFHRSHLINGLSNPQWELQSLHPNSLKLTEGYQKHNLHASYLHLHWGENRLFPERFVKYCRNYKTSLY